MAHQKSTVQHNTQIGKYLTSAKKACFDPLLTSLMQQASEELQATAGELRFLRVQQVIKLCKQKKTQQETTILQNYCRKVAVVTAITS